jgi:dTDP-4-amino-4,6-dideoxygalactose transaminase
MKEKTNDETCRMVDLRRQYDKIREEINGAIQEVLDSTEFINGAPVQRFCDHLARYNDVAHVVPCANGTDALQIALMALGLQPGDEVIVPVFTYVATAEVIALLRLKPVFADCDAGTFNLDITRVEEKITGRTRAIVPVHLFGQCVDMEPLLAIARRHRLFVVEDAAQSIGAGYRFSDGRVVKAGCMGDIGTTSFFPSKNLGAYGDGGALFTRDDALAEKARVIANHGQRVKYHHDLVGCNSRLDTLQAAILDVKLKYLDDYTRARQAVAAAYDEALAGAGGVIPPRRVPYSTHVFHQYTLRVRDGQRDALQAHLKREAIPSMIYYPIPLHLQRAYRQEGIGDGAFPVAERLCREVLSLPIHTELPAAQVEKVATCIHRHAR